MMHRFLVLVLVAVFSISSLDAVTALQIRTQRTARGAGGPCCCAQRSAPCPTCSRKDGSGAGDVACRLSQAGCTAVTLTTVPQITKEFQGDASVTARPVSGGRERFAHRADHYAFAPSTLIFHPPKY